MSALGGTTCSQEIFAGSLLTAEVRQRMFVCGPVYAVRVQLHWLDFPVLLEPLKSTDRCEGLPEVLTLY